MECKEEVKRGEREKRGDDGLLHFDVTYRTAPCGTKQPLKGDDRIFVLKQHADARPVILLAPA